VKDPGEYKAVNSLLHNLHAEHQFRRVLSSSSSSIPFTADDGRIYPHATSMQTSGKDVPMSLSHPPPPPFPDGRASFAKDSHLETRASLQPENHMVLDEGQRVKVRYEDTNKLLRSLFLNRRRELSGPLPEFPS